MAQIKNEAAYRAALKRVEQLEELVDDDNPIMDDNALELDMLVDMIEEYEDIHYPIGKPSLVDTIKLRLYEMGHIEGRTSNQSETRYQPGDCTWRLSQVSH